MSKVPSIFETCVPRPEVLAGELPDAIFAADLWDVIISRAGTHQDYLNPERFFRGTYPTANLKQLIKDVTERLAGKDGGTPVFLLETGFGGGKTHSLIAAVHAAREGSRLSHCLRDFNISQFPDAGTVKIAAFVGEDSDPLSGTNHVIEDANLKVYTPWGQISALAGGIKGYELIRINDEQGIAPGRENFAKSLGEAPLLILIDELVLYMARALALKDDHPRAHVNSQFPTFLQLLFSIAAQRPKTVVILTLPSEQDANRRLTGELKQYISSVMESVNEVGLISGRQVKNLTPTQANERGAVLGKRLFDSYSTADAPKVAELYSEYYEKQRNAGAIIDGRAFEPNYREQIQSCYPFHPELVSLFAERLGDIPDFQATRGALRLVAKLIRYVWANRISIPNTLMLHPFHVDLTRNEIRDEILSRLGRMSFERGLEADVVSISATTHSMNVETSWPWKAASESALVTFLHSLPDGSKGITSPEVALSVGRPDVDLSYVPKALEETEKHAWYMRKEGSHYLFRTRASVNKRFQERLVDLRQRPAEVKSVLEDWIKEIFSNFNVFKIIPFPSDQTAIPDHSDHLRLAIIHFDKEVGAVAPGASERLNFVRTLFNNRGSSSEPRIYRNNLLFLLAEGTKTEGLKEAVRSVMAWQHVQEDIIQEQKNVATTENVNFAEMKKKARDNVSGVPAEFMALEDDLIKVKENIGIHEVNVRSRILESYRVLACPRAGSSENESLFSSTPASVLECYRVDFGEVPEGPDSLRRTARRAAAEAPLLQCLRNNGKLVPESTPAQPLVLAAEIIKRPPLWSEAETHISTADVWDRLRREPDLPIVLKQTDILPTFLAGLATNPDPLWSYYDKQEKKLYTRVNSAELNPTLSDTTFLYDVAAAIRENIRPVSTVKTSDISDNLWPREGTLHKPTVSTLKLLDAAKQSPLFPVLPDRPVLWRAMQEGVRENRWILFQKGLNIAVGSQELNEWPSQPRFDDSIELWLYQPAIEKGIYPRRSGPDISDAPSVLQTAINVKARCWSAGSLSMNMEDVERNARNIWRSLTRFDLEEIIKEGIRERVWFLWKKNDEGEFYTDADVHHVRFDPAGEYHLVESASEKLIENLAPLRPGFGPQPIERVNTPRLALTEVWEALAPSPDIRVAELTISVSDRESFDNTLRAAWADRPKNALIHSTLSAQGRRNTGEKDESINLMYEGKFENIQTLMAPIWSFSSGELQVSITATLKFDDPPKLSDQHLEGFRTSLMNADQGQIAVRLVPARRRNRSKN